MHLFKNLHHWTPFNKITNSIQFHISNSRWIWSVSLDNFFAMKFMSGKQITSDSQQWCGKLGHFPCVFVETFALWPLLLISCGYHRGGLQCQSHVIYHTICGQRSLMSITQRPHFLMTKEKASSEWVALLFTENFEFVAAFALLTVFWWGNCWARDNWRGSVKRWLGRRR